MSPALVTRQKRPGETEAVNRHVLHEASDFAASLDELQMYCPDLEHVALVVSWFGDDLRAGNCRIRPAVTTSNGSGCRNPGSFRACARGPRMVVSTHDGGAAYGGTPSDRSVMDAIAEIKARGLKVTLYPFIMMDSPQTMSCPILTAIHRSRPILGADGSPATRAADARFRRSYRNGEVADRKRFAATHCLGSSAASADTIIFSGLAH